MKKIFRLWHRKGKASSSPQAPSAEGAALLRMLAETEEQELSCDEVHLVLAEFTERQRRGEDVAHLMPLVQKHLELCPDCREEHEALLQALAFEEQRRET